MKFWAGRWQAIVQSLYLNPVGEMERTLCRPGILICLPSVWQAVNGLADRRVYFERAAARGAKNTDFLLYELAYGGS